MHAPYHQEHIFHNTDIAETYHEAFDFTKDKTAKTMISDVETIPDLSLAQRDITSLGEATKWTHKIKRPHSPTIDEYSRQVLLYTL